MMEKQHKLVPTGTLTAAEFHFACPVAVFLKALLIYGPFARLHIGGGICIRQENQS